MPHYPVLQYMKLATKISDVKGLKILDWGGNCGTLLQDGLKINEISEHDYTCVDIDTDVILECREKYPNANWIVRPVKHPVYDVHQNDQDIDVEPHLNKYDIVFAYSVYTHDVWEKIEQDLELLYDMTCPGGKVCFTFIDPEVAQVFRIKRIQEYGDSVPENAFNNIEDWLYFVNHDTLTKNYDRNLKCDYFISIFDAEWIKNKIKDRWSNCEIFKPDFSKVKNFATEAWQPSIVIHKPHK